MSQQSGRRLYIGRLSQDATRKDVEAYFGAVGPIVDVRLMAGFCFLEFEELKVSCSVQISDGEAGEKHLVRGLLPIADAVLLC